MILSTQVREQRVKTPHFDLRTGLATTPIFSGFPPMASTEEAEPEIQAYAPLTTGEIVPWMQMTTVANMLLWGQQADYQNVGGKFASVSGDPYIPGCRVENIYIESQRGSVAGTEGMVVATPKGKFVVSYQQARVIAVEDLLAWGAHLYGWSYQFAATLAQWTEIAHTPITGRVRFSNVYGFIVPNFIKFQTRFPAPVAMYTIGTSSPVAQSLSLTGRSTSDYGKVLFEQKFDVAEGENETILVVTGFPFADAFVAELMPSKATLILDYIKVFP